MKNVIIIDSFLHSFLNGTGSALFNVLAHSPLNRVNALLVVMQVTTSRGRKMQPNTRASTAKLKTGNAARVRKLGVTSSRTDQSRQHPRQHNEDLIGIKKKRFIWSNINHVGLGSPLPSVCVPYGQRR